MKLVTLGQVESEYEDHLRRILRAGTWNIQFVRPRPELHSLVASWDETTDLLEKLLNLYPDISDTRFLLFSPDSLRFRAWCQNKARHAQWGCCLGGVVAVEYANLSVRLVTQLHETLHAFGVDECYDETSFLPRTSCNVATCFMRYGIDSTEVCNNVLDQLRRASEG
jgi:hypothetical protein